MRSQPASRSSQWKQTAQVGVARNCKAETTDLGEWQGELLSYSASQVRAAGIRTRLALKGKLRLRQTKAVTFYALQTPELVCSKRDGNM